MTSHAAGSCEDKPTPVKSDPPKADPSKPSPNEGIPCSAGPYKLWYASERIQLPPEYVTPLRFGNDRDRLYNQPGFHITGKCPSCNHDTSGVCATEYLAQDVASATSNNGVRMSATALQPAAQPHEAVDGNEALRGPTKQITVLQCACTANHVGPAGTFGCGSEWLLRVDFNPSSEAKATISGVSADEAFRCWSAADAAAAAVPTALTTAQAAITKWQAGLAAIITLLGISALLGGRTTIQALSSPWRVCFGIAAFIAVLAAVFMLYQSDLASFGSPRINKALNPLDLEDANLNPLIQASAAVRRLRRSVWATGIAVVAALAAASVLLFVGAAPAAVAPPTSKITYKTNAILQTTSCGLVISGPTPAPGQPAATTLTFKPTGGSSETIQLSDIQSIVAC